eukprot:Hpha_TRINITY_DN16358_c1_g1::TRINITY_DN16358_c1_g1_i1::g.60288::m.60288
MAYPVERVLQQLARVMEYNRGTAQLHEDSDPFAVFDCVEEPGISIGDFMLLVCRGLSEWELALAVVLVDRLTKRCDKPLNPFNAHRLMLTALIISTKWNRDAKVMSHFVTTTGMERDDLVQMEVSFLREIDWAVRVEPNELRSAMDAMPDENADEPDKIIGFMPLVPRQVI